MNWHHRHSESRTLGARVADRVAAFVGSWTFIWIQTSLMAVWIAGNVYLLLHIDPFPFMILNSDSARRPDPTPAPEFGPTDSTIP